MGPSLRALLGVVRKVKGCRATPEPLTGHSGAPIEAPGARRRFWRGHGLVESLLDCDSGGKKPVTGGASSCGLDRSRQPAPTSFSGVGAGGGPRHLGSAATRARVFLLRGIQILEPSVHLWAFSTCRQRSRLSPNRRLVQVVSALAETQVKIIASLDELAAPSGPPPGGSQTSACLTTEGLIGLGGRSYSAGSTMSESWRRMAKR